MTQAKAWIDFLTACFGLVWVAIGVPLVAWWSWSKMRKLDRASDEVDARLRASIKNLDRHVRGLDAEGRAN